jgi:hypothetical protein
LTEGPTWDKIKSAGSKLAQQITNKQVSAKTLLKNWEKRGKPDDSGIVANILQQGNVTDDVIQDIYSAMGIEIKTTASATPAPSSTSSPSPSPSQSANTTTATAQPTSGKINTPAQAVDLIVKAFPKFLPQITAELMKRQGITGTGQ